MASNLWFFYALSCSVLWGFGYTLAEKMLRLGVPPSFLMLTQALICLPLYVVLSTKLGQFKAGMDFLDGNKGVLLLILAAKQFTARPHPGEQAEMPEWMKAIDTFTPVKAASLGVLLSAVNPKNLMMCVAAGIAISEGELSVGDQIVAVAVFTVIAVCSVAVPVIVYVADTERMRRPLDSLRTWLERNNTTVMVVLLLVIGVVLIGKGIGGLIG